MMFSAYLAGLAAGAGLIMAIGAQNAFVLRQGLVRSHVGKVVLVCAIADIALIVLGVAGMGAAVQGHPGVVQVLRFAGAAFLLCYGFMAAKRAWLGQSGLQAADATAQNGFHVMAACLAFTLLNPHVYLDTVMLLGALSTRYDDGAQYAFASGASTASIAWFISLGYGARLLQPVFRNPHAWRILDGLVAVLMLTLAGVLVFKAPVG